MKAFSRSRPTRALEVGGLLGLAIFLWGLVFLPIQRLGLVCECVVWVSEPQQATLSTLSGRSGIASSAIDWFFYEAASAGSPSGQKPVLEGEIAVRRVRLRLGLMRRMTISELERELERLAASSRSPERPSGAAMRAISHARWKLKVAEHALERFHLDCSRPGCDSSDGAGGSPFHLVSQPTAPTAPRDTNKQRMLESLGLEVEAARQALSLAESLPLEGQHATQAVLALAGPPKFRIRGGSLNRFRASFVVLSSIGILCAVSAGWVRSLIREPQIAAIPTHQDFIRMLERLRVPYLGSLTDPSGNSKDDPVKRLSTSRSRLRSLHRLSMLSRWSNRMLTLWVACFAFRYCVEPLWRELLFQAPLAAFSRVLFGI